MPSPTLEQQIILNELIAELIEDMVDNTAKLEEIRVQLKQVLENQVDATMQALRLHEHNHEEWERRDFH